jgi:hypothetical protein
MYRRRQFPSAPTLLVGFIYYSPGHLASNEEQSGLSMEFRPAMIPWRSFEFAARCILALICVASLISISAQANDLASIQECLTFGGYYSGVADGRGGRLTDDAIRAFQRSIGRPETELGLLTAYDVSRLNEACEEKKRKLGWAPYRLASTDITIELPLGILALKEDSPETRRETRRFIGLDGAVGI